MGVSENLRLILDPNEQGENLPLFAQRLDTIMKRAACNQTRLGVLMDEANNRWVRAKIINRPLREVGCKATQAMVSKALSGDKRPEQFTLKLIIQALYDRYTSEDLADTCRFADTPVPVFLEEEAESLFTLAGYILPSKVREVSVKTTGDIASVNSVEFNEQVRRMARAAKNKKFHRTTFQSPEPAPIETDRITSEQ